MVRNYLTEFKAKDLEDSLRKVLLFQYTYCFFRNYGFKPKAIKSYNQLFLTKLVLFMNLHSSVTLCNAINCKRM